MEREKIQNRDIQFECLENAQELKRIRLLADQVWPETYKEILTQEQISYMMEMMYAQNVMENELHSGVFFYICKVDGKDAGYITLSASREAPGRAKLHKVYLLPDHQGCGIGQKMLAFACEKCAEKGFSSVYLTVNKQNFKAQKAYKRADFIVEDAVCCDIGNGFVMDDFIMGKEL